jgi:hypothetical protein
MEDLSGFGFNFIDEFLLGTAKVERVLGGMDNDEDIGGDPLLLTQHDEEGLSQSPRTKATTLPRVKDQAVKEKKVIQ